MSFFSKKILPIGLDISDMSIKFAQLYRSGEKIRLQSIGKIPLPDGIVEKGEIKDDKALIEKINQLLDKPKHGEIKAREIVATLPDTKTFIKMITVDKGANELKSIIEPEIEKHIPLLLKEIYYDWQLVSESQDKYFVLIGAAPKSLVDDYCSLIKRAGYSIQALEIESVAACRSLLAEENRKFKRLENINYGILDIGAKKTTLIFYANGSIVMTIGMPISGDDITDKIAKTLEIKKEQAEKAKIICGFDKSMAQGIISDILSDMIKELTAKINSAMDYYSSHFPELGAINKILITGGGANIKNLNIILSEITGLNFIISNPLLHISESDSNLKKYFNETLDLNMENDKAKNISTVQNNASSYAVAIGLSLRDLNS